MRKVRPMSEYTLEEFRRKFPHLARELGGAGTLQIDAVRTSLKEAEKAAHSIQGYEPTAVDFIRRCDTDNQALEIINFLEARGAIDPDYAKRLRSQLVRCGVRSFGPKKNPGYYYEQG
jgi:hypothetical protein